MELNERDLDDLDFTIINKILIELHNVTALHINKISEICTIEREQESIEYAIAIKNLLLKHKAARPHANIDVIARNDNSMVYATSDYFKVLKNGILEKEKVNIKAKEKDELEIKNLKQQTGVSFIIGIIAIIISLLSLGITIYLFYKDL